MPKNSIITHFHDFHPSENSKFFIDSILNEIYQELPRGSTVRASFYKKDKMIKATLQVSSYQGPLFATTADTDLREVVSRLVEQMRRRVEKFKTKKHQHEGLKQIIKRVVFASERNKGA